MLQGREPTFQLFIKEGECIKPILPTNYEMAGQTVLAETMTQEKPKRKLNSWQRYIKVKKNQIKIKSGKNKGKLDLKKMARAYKKGRKK